MEGSRRQAYICKVMSQSVFHNSHRLVAELAVSNVTYSMPWTGSVLLTLVLLNPDMSCYANSIDPDQLASEEAN